MAPAAKRARAAGESTDDRLSTLPDALLHAVMSFLPARQMVQTTVLSKRWVDLWRSVPCVNLDSNEFLSKFESSTEKLEKIVHFTTNLLMFHNALTLDTFRFKGKNPSSNRKQKRHVDTWIRRGIKYCPRELEILVYTGSSPMYELPNLGSSSCRLKRLHLSSVILGSGFAEQLSAGCPVLEDLELHDCYNEFRDIQSNTLKNLVVAGCSSPSHDMLVIRAPGLTFLRLQIAFDTYKNGVLLHGLNSLVEASIALLTMYSEIAPRGEAMLLGGLFCVTRLELSGIQALADEELDKFPSFDNLKTLSLANCFQGKSHLNEKLKAVGRLLQRAPNLEKLTLHDCYFLFGSQIEKQKTSSGGLCLQNQDQVPFQCKKLKFVEIKYDDYLCCDHGLFQLMWVFWRNLHNVTINLTKIQEESSEEE